MLDITYSTETILMLSTYHRMYTSYGLPGYLFELDVANVYRDIMYLEHAVKWCNLNAKKSLCNTLCNIKCCITRSFFAIFVYPENVLLMISDALAES